MRICKKYGLTNRYDNCCGLAGQDKSVLFSCTQFHRAILRGAASMVIPWSGASFLHCGWSEVLRKVVSAECIAMRPALRR